MAIFPVLVTEVLSKFVDIQADSIESAITEARSKWKGQEIVLDADDFADVQFEDGHPYLDEAESGMKSND